MGNVVTTGVRVSENDGSDEILKANDVKMENVNENSEPIEDRVMSEISSLRDEEEENGFRVGDFVWGENVNCHQWWPGQIYDSSDASDLALKTMQKGKLLVAFFGDGNFAWCNPLQLKPFFENFKEFSKMSGSRGFLSAVEEAVGETGGKVEQFLVCEEASLFSSVAKNSGIKEGVLVPDVRREVLASLVLESDPEVVLGDVKNLAKTVSFSDTLEIEVLKRKIFVFYRCKGRFDLAKYDEDRFIMGLEHKDDESCQRSLRKCSGFVRRSRKHDRGSKIETAEEEISNGKRLSWRKRGLADDDGIEKREESKDSNHLEENEKRDNSGIELVVDFSTPLASVCKRLRVDVSSSVKRNSGNGESLVQTGKRERKKSKYLSPEYMTGSSWRSRKSRVESESNQIRVSERMTTEKAIDFQRLETTPEEMVDLIRAAALSTQYPKDYTNSSDILRKFVSIYRSFMYHDGANYRIQKRTVSDEKKLPEVLMQEVVSETVKKQFSGVELWIDADLGYTLPSKDDLIKIYKNFGALDKKRSYVLDNNSSACIAFLNACDGEEAFNRSLEKCPFATTSTITFKLKYPSSASSEGLSKKKETETRKCVMEIECLRQKLEEIRSVLDQAEGKFTKELKMKLEDESRNLVDKVKRVVSDIVLSKFQ